MRGKGQRGELQALGGGITPACAGKSPGTAGRTQRGRGSPPRVRGKGRPWPFPRGQSRITPACAGKSLRTARHRTRHRDHPRVCGEKIPPVQRHQGGVGSPPRVRGKVTFRTAESRRKGITPACAGKSRSWPSRCRSARDHPRVCGEKLLNGEAKAMQRGSPPRVRGKDIQTIVLQNQGGITPACAGKRHNARSQVNRLRDHPRVCGEKLRLCEFLLSSLGSPPRVRGKEAGSIQR